MMTSPLAPELASAVTAVAKRLRESEPALVAELSDMMKREIDQLDSDPKLVELLEASVHGNVSTIIHVLANGIPVDHLQPTTAAVEYALRLAQRDVSSNSLMRAYLLGQNSMTLHCLRLVQELGLSSDDTVTVARHISDILFGYIEWITQYVFQAYENERRRWLGAEGNVLSSTVHQLLDGADPEGRAFEQETGYRLQRNHIAMILWETQGDARGLSTLDRAGRDLAAKLLSDGPPLVTAIDRSTVWVWIPLRDTTSVIESEYVAQRADLPAGVHVALGLPGTGLTGFRRSHEQAVAAYSVATMPDSSSARVLGFGDRGVAVVSLLAQDLDSTRSWVREVLGDLADDTENAAMLRETLSVYFATRESHLHTAEQLNLHRNTVKYRVGKALGATSPNRDRMDLALALTVCEFLGPAVLGPRH